MQFRLLVTPELIKAAENLSVELWDSDRHSADDIVGKIELPMQKMIQHPGKMYPQVSKLAGMDAESEMPGQLHWEVGYFAKPQFRPALRTDGKDKNLPKELQDRPEFQDDKGVTNTETDDAVQHTPPDPLWPSGVCNIIVHQIVNLELENIKGSEGNRNGREYEPAKPYGETKEQEGGELPTSYCTILFNDELVYRTRSKAVSSQPIFNAGTERFIRDWRSTIITVTVRDSRNREHDPILGVVPLKLSEILDTSSQVTRWYPLDGGIVSDHSCNISKWTSLTIYKGFGRIRISLLFRSVETRLPPNILGWDVGTFEFLSNRILATGYPKQAKLKMRTGGSIGRLSRKSCQALTEGDGHFWDLEPQEGQEKIRLPVKYRYRSPIVFEFHISGKRKADAYAVVWLHHLVDNEETPISIPIWQTSRPERLTQNYITESNCHNEIGLEDLQEVGRLQFRARFKAGMDESHKAFISDNDSRETFETWEACLAEGVRTREIDAEIPQRLREMHDKSLTEGRDILKEADPKEKQKWLSKTGTDWSGAFGHDPAAYMVKGVKKREPGADDPIHRDPHHPSDDEHPSADEDSDNEDTTSSSSSDLGIKDAESGGAVSSNGKPSIDTVRTNGTATTSGSSQKDINKQNKRTEHRKHRGLMQWKPARNVKFAASEGKIGLRKLKQRVTGDLNGRQPGVETETGS